MDSKTGKIVPLTEEQAESLKQENLERMAAGLNGRRLVPVPPGELPRIQSMNRRQRRAWAARQRKAVA